MTTTNSHFPNNGSAVATVSTRRSVQDVAADLPQDWPLLPLGRFYLFSNGANSDKGAYGSGVPFINVLDVLNHTHINARHILGRVLLPTQMVDSFSVRRGDILFNRTSETQEEVGLASTYADDAPVIFGGFVIRARPIDNTFDPTYAGYGFRAPAVRRQIIAKGQGAIRANIGQTGLKSVLVPIPPMSEQRAIAAALADVDELIGALEKLIAKKRAIKLASMQQLLTGKTRLPGFIGKWQNTNVRSVVLNYFCGPSPTCEERNIEGEEEWGVLKTTAVTWESGWDWTKHKVLPRAYWNQPEKEVQIGDVVVTKAGPRHRVGVTAWVDRCPSRILVSGKMIGLRPNPEKTVGFMLAAAISRREPQRFLDQRTTGMAESQVNFENSALLEATIVLPPLDEQRAIGSVINNMDAEIAALEQRCDKTKAIKQGMMQSLLTGRIRLVEPSGKNGGPIE